MKLTFLNELLTANFSSLKRKSRSFPSGQHYWGPIPSATFTFIVLFFPWLFGITRFLMWKQEPLYKSKSYETDGVIIQIY